MAATVHQLRPVFDDPIPQARPEFACRKKSKRCLRTECIVSALLITFLAMFVTWTSSAIVRAGYDLVQARSELTKIEKQNELLRLEMAQLKSHSRIQHIAENKLGMVKPAVVFVATKKERSSTPDSERRNDQFARKGITLVGSGRAEAKSLQ